MIDKLKKYGLNTYEAKAYLTLLKLGLSTSSPIAKESRVPYGKIYPVLSSLESKEFIKIYTGTPKRFIAIEPSIILNKVVDKRLHSINNLKESSKTLIKQLETPKLEKIKPLELINIVEGKKNYLNLSVKLHEKAKKEWKTIQTLPLYQPHIQSYKDMIKTGVKVKILTYITEKNKENLKIWKKLDVEIRILKKPQSRFTVIDNKEVILRVTDANIGGYIAIHIKNPSLAQTLSRSFDQLWGESKNIETFVFEE